MQELAERIPKPATGRVRSNRILAGKSDTKPGRLCLNPLEWQLREWVIEISTTNIRVSADEPPLFGPLNRSRLCVCRSLVRPQRCIKGLSMLVERQSMKRILIVLSKARVQELISRSSDPTI